MGNPETAQGQGRGAGSSPPLPSLPSHRALGKGIRRMDWSGMLWDWLGKAAQMAASRRFTVWPERADPAWADPWILPPIKRLTASGRGAHVKKYHIFFGDDPRKTCNKFCFDLSSVQDRGLRKPLSANPGGHWPRSAPPREYPGKLEKFFSQRANYY